MSKVCLIKSNEIVNGSGLFGHDDNIMTWDSGLESLEDGSEMFYHCDALVYFRASTPRLVKGYKMFSGLQNGIYDPNTAAPEDLPNIRLDFDNLVDGNEMFKGSYLTIVSNNVLSSGYDLFPKLKNGTNMFQYSKIFVNSNYDGRYDNLSYLSFPSVVNADGMFQCGESVGYINNYNGNFTAVTNFSNMFAGANGLQYVYLTDLLKWGDYYNSSADACLSTSSEYWNAQYNGCDVSMRKMFYLSDAHNVYLTVSANAGDCRIDATEMFYYTEVPTTVFLSESLTEKLKNCYRMFYQSTANYVYDQIANLAISNALHLPNVVIAEEMFKGSVLHGGLYLSLPAVENTKNLASFSSYITDVDVYVKQLEMNEFYQCQYLKTANITITGGASCETDFYNTFCFCPKLESVTINGNTKIKTCYGMFASCDVLNSISVGDGIDFSEVTDTRGMFDYCTDITGDTVRPITNKINTLIEASGMFRACWDLDVMPFTFEQMSRIQDGSNMFYYCISMNTQLHSEWQNYEKELYYLTTASSMFCGCGIGGRWYYAMPNLVTAYNMFDSSNFEYFGRCGSTMELQHLQNADRMFQNCDKLSECNIEIPYATTALEMFKGCSSLRTVSELRMYDLETSESMFYNCLALTDVTIGNLNNLKRAGSMFEGCRSLENITLLHPQGYVLENTKRMFVTQGDLSISTDDGYDHFILESALNAEEMFAGFCSAYLPSNITPDQFPILQLSSGIRGHYENDLSTITNMFNARTITDGITATFIGAVSYYNNVSSSQTLGSIYLTDNNLIEDLNANGTWERSEAYPVNGQSYVRYEMTRQNAADKTISLTVYCDEIDEISPYAIVEGSDYIPDASSWNADFADSGILTQVTSVHDGYAWTNS